MLHILLAFGMPSCLLYVNAGQEGKALQGSGAFSGTSPQGHSLCVLLGAQSPGSHARASRDWGRVCACAERAMIEKLAIAYSGAELNFTLLVCPWGPVPWGHRQILPWSSFVLQPEFKERRLSSRCAGTQDS